MMILKRLTRWRQILQINASRVVQISRSVRTHALPLVCLQERGRKLPDDVLLHGADEAQVGLVVLVGCAEGEVCPGRVKRRALGELDRSSDSVHVD